MRQRLLSAAVLVPVVVIAFLVGRPWTSIGIALVAALAAWETAQLVRAAGLPANRWLVVAAPILAAVAFEVRNGTFFFGLEWAAVIGGAACWVAVAAVDGLRHREPRAGFLAWSGTVLASLYISMLAFAIALLGFGAVASTLGSSNLLPSGLDRGRFWLLVLVLSVWALDSAAYVVGRYFPRGHFMNHISPNKTWSGAIGGTVAAVVVSTALISVGGLSPLVGVVVGLVIAVAAQAGDLTESMIKRAAGAKDSGTLIPGHGGFLDRLDSFVFAAPALYVTLVLLAVAKVSIL